MNLSQMQAIKQAFVGMGLDIPFGQESRDPDHKWNHAANIGIPHGIAYVRRHKDSGLGLGMGLTGPQVSLSLNKALGGKKSDDKKKHKTKEGCGGSKMAAMREELLAIKQATVLDRIRSMGNPMSHMGEHAYDVGGLGILAAPVADKLQAMARARVAGDSGEDAVKRRQFISEPVGEAMELGGLGTLAAPGIGQLVKGMRGKH